MDDVDRPGAIELSEKRSVSVSKVVGQSSEDGLTEVKAKRLPRSEKKRRRREELLAKRKEMRKDKKLAKKRKHPENVAVDSEESKVVDNDDKSEHDRRSLGHISRKQRRTEVQSRCKQALASGQRICIDCGLGGHMTDKECSKLAQQIGRLYGSNRKSNKPLHIYLSGLKKDEFTYKECVRKNSGFENYIMDIHEESYEDLFEKEEIVYLTPDSENVLEALDSSKVYIIGGLVDESAKKKITLSDAEKLELNTAKFPIDKYMARVEGGNYKQALAVNQVADILLEVAETGDWSKALSENVPKRTGFVLRDMQ